MAQSLFAKHPMHAVKCTKVCPHTPVFQFTKLFDRPLLSAIVPRVPSMFTPIDWSSKQRVLLGMDMPDEYVLFSVPVCVDLLCIDFACFLFCRSTVPEDRIVWCGKHRRFAPIT